MSSPARNLRVGLRCDAGHHAGVGHAVRLLALAEELQHRGAQVVHLGVLDVPWLRDAYAAHEIDQIPAPPDAPALTALARRLDLHAVVLDGYDLDPTAGAALRTAGIVVLAMVDDTFGAAQEADLYVDQNLGARPRDPLPSDAIALAGIDYALFRDSVLDRRPLSPPPAGRVGRGASRGRIETPDDGLAVLAVFGGTDPFGAAPVLVRLLLDTGLPVELTVVASDPDVRARLEALPRHPGQVVHAVGPLTDLPGAAARSDLTISASGSSVWELLCLGVPTAVVCVVDNQEPGYRETVRRGVVAGLGTLESLRADGTEATRELHRLLAESHRRRLLSDRGRELVDGGGRRRVADALERVVDAANGPPGH